MPLVEGESLRDVLNRDKQLPIETALRIAREVAGALSQAHAQGVVHRDIKPEYILIEAGHAVVADFGIALAVSRADATRLTETGLSIGTPTYMSPEQAAGEQQIDGRSDLYSLGCVVHEMLGGEPPFTGPTVESVIHQHLAVDPPLVTNLRPAVPASVAAVLRHALAIERGSGWSSRAMEIAAIHAFRGNADSALTWLERGYGAGYRTSRLLAQDPMFAPIRSDRRVTALLQRMDEAAARERARVEAGGIARAVDSMIGSQLRR